MIRLLFALFGRAIHRHIEQSRLRPKGFDGMHHAFADADGRAYYTWMDLTEMTPVRQKHIERCLMMGDAGIGEKTLDTLCTIAEERIMDAVKESNQSARSKALAKATQAIGMIRNRRKEVIPEEVMYDLGAILAIREDEDPRGFDPAIHQQKIAMMSAAGRAGHDFFTRLPALGKLLGYSLTTEEAFIALLAEWSMERARMKGATETLAR